MALGKGHQSFNFICGIFLFFFLTFYFNAFISISFLIGFLFSTLLISPDIDLGPTKKFGLAGLLLFPYSIFFKHRGVSHSFIFGTLTRIIYGLIVLVVLIFILNKLQMISIDQRNLFNSFISFIKHYNYSMKEYQITTWLFIGMFSADGLHIFLDKISSAWKALVR